MGKDTSLMSNNKNYLAVLFDFLIYVFLSVTSTFVYYNKDSTLSCAYSSAVQTFCNSYKCR